MNAPRTNEINKKQLKEMEVYARSKPPIGTRLQAAKVRSYAQRQTRPFGGARRLETCDRRPSVRQPVRLALEKLFRLVLGLRHKKPETHQSQNLRHTSS